MFISVGCHCSVARASSPPMTCLLRLNRPAALLRLSWCKFCARVCFLKSEPHAAMALLCFSRRLLSLIISKRHRFWAKIRTRTSFALLDSAHFLSSQPPRLTWSVGYSATLALQAPCCYYKQTSRSTLYSFVELWTSWSSRGYVFAPKSRAPSSCPVPSRQKWWSFGGTCRRRQSFIGIFAWKLGRLRASRSSRYIPWRI